MTAVNNELWFVTVFAMLRPVANQRRNRPHGLEFIAGHVQFVHGAASGRNHNSQESRVSSQEGVSCDFLTPVP